MTRRAGGWGTPILLTLLAAALSIIGPGLLIFIPFALLLLALPPRRPILIAVALALLFVGISGRSSDVLWWFARGWALMLGAWFVVMVTMMPRSAFTTRSIAAVFATTASAAVMLLVSRTGFGSLDYAIGQRLRQSAATIAAAWTARQPATGESAGWSNEAVAAMNRVIDAQSLLYPALLAIASLAGLAVAYWAWRRFAYQEEQPFGPLREFRFRDELVWVLVVAIVLIVLPLNEAATRTGANLMTFMGALYALRGLAVLLALFGVPGPLGVLIGAVILIFLSPMVLATTLVLGLSDTWLDLRARARGSSTGA